MRTPLLLFFLTAFITGLPAWAEGDLTPQTAAKIDWDTNQAHQAIDKKYGNRKSSELTSQERRQVIEERAAAEREVLEKHKVDAKAYNKYTTRQTKDERAATQQAATALEAQAKGEAEKKAKEKDAALAPKEIPIQRGGTHKDGIVMEEKEGATPIVEKGLPQEAEDDQNAAGQKNSTKAKAKSRGKRK